MSLVGALSKRREPDAADHGASLGDTELAALYERYQHEVFRVALRYGRGNASWAEDVMQDVFLRLARAKPQLRDHDDLSGWFYRVTTRRCLNKLRREALLSSLLGRLLWGERTDTRTPESHALTKDELSRAFDAVSRLPLKQRAAFFMLHVDQKSQQEIGEILGHSKGYVSKLLQRASQRLLEEGWEIEP